MYTLWSLTCSGGSVLYKVRRKLLSQNFLYNRTLINSLVRRSSIGKNDTVLEIGSGKGFITLNLLEVAKKVIAIELDEKLVLHLKQFLDHYPNLEIVHNNFLNFHLPYYPYKVFANIPFAIEGKIVRKLLGSEHPPEDCYLVVMKELAFRLSGIPKDNQFSLKHKPWFDFYIYHYFKRSDFIPSPSVDSVMWRIFKKEQPSLPLSDYKTWERFIEIGFGQGTLVNVNLRKILTKEQMNYLSNKLNFSLKTKPGNFSINQWLEIYSYFKNFS